MNYRMIKYVLGWILLFETMFLAVPLITSIVYMEAAFFYFLITMAITAAIGSLLIMKKPKNKTIYSREGVVIVAFSWITLSLFGALPFYLSGSIPSFVDAVFETVSGFTTTGASILKSVEDLPKSMIMWRGFTHWVGGMGVLVFIMAFLPLGGAYNMHIMKAESPGPSVSKLVPRVRTTALILYCIYIALTVIQFICLLIAGMSVFDAINTAFATAGTGGGLKISRLMIFFKGMFREMRKLIHPKKVENISIDSRPVENGIVVSVGAYISCYIMLFTASVLVLAFNNHDFTTNFTSVLSCLNNIGPGLSEVGPTSNFAIFSPVSKIVLIFDMLAGRLEVFPMILIFSPITWKK